MEFTARCTENIGEGLGTNCNGEVEVPVGGELRFFQEQGLR